MQKTAILAARLKKLKNEYRKRNYQRVVVDGQKIISRYPGCVPALIAFSRAVQLLQDDEIPGNADAVYKKSTQAMYDAVAVDPASVEARNELAYHVYVYEDERRAIAHFDEAIRLARAQLKEAIIGKIKCLGDLGRHAEKKKVFAEAAAIFGKDRKLKAASASQALRP